MSLHEFARTKAYLDDCFDRQFEGGHGDHPIIIQFLDRWMDFIVKSGRGFTFTVDDKRILHIESPKTMSLRFIDFSDLTPVDEHPPSNVPRTFKRPKIPWKATSTTRYGHANGQEVYITVARK
jgi:hypothetical protein